MVSLKVEEAWNLELLLKGSHSEKKKKVKHRHMSSHKHQENLGKPVSCIRNQHSFHEEVKNGQKLVYHDKYRIIEKLVIRLNRMNMG